MSFLQKKDALYIAIFLLCPLLIFSQAENRLNDVQLGEATKTTFKKIKEISSSIELVSIKNPRFPLVITKEAHIICEGVKTSYGQLDKVIFTFADDQLVYLEAHGNTDAVFARKQSEAPRSYLEYDAYVSQSLIINKSKDIAWVMNREALKLNLFIWQNPLFNNVKDHKNTAIDHKLPEFLNMGETLEKIKPSLIANSDFTSSKDLDGSDPNADFQITCFGVDYLGFPRTVEARFGVNQLNAVWILTAKNEENRIRQALKSQFGAPVLVNEKWEVFDNWNVALRKDKPEILLLTEAVALEYKNNSFFNQ
ncbi:hypothetical protein [Yeosuana marina]|uniref:hypothetical protein n=1 Tax=Yeosuana marina TaxID=1565536 RepID=UPI0030ED7DEE